MAAANYALRHVIGDESRRWKNVTLKIMGGTEELTMPMMQASTAYDVKAMLADALSEDPNKIELYDKLGCKFKRMRNCEEIATKVLVKGIKRFARREEEYPHPFITVGGGHLSLRQALHWIRKGQDFMLFERKTKIGGNAWNGIANKWSKLQSEGPHYHLNWDSFDGHRHVMMPFEQYSFWPTRDEIITHFHDILTQYNVWPYMNMSTQIMEMDIIPAPYGAPECMKAYRMRHLYVGDKFNKNQDVTNDALDDTGNYKNEGFFTCSCISFYPGALAAPHRKTFPGEEVFGGQIGYGFNDEFDYAATKKQKGIVIGMGAFSVENVRTLMENDAKKFFVIARHHNLLLPRMLSWYVNQSQMPPPAAVVLRAMEPIYKLYGADPWGFFSITATADRSHASIKQYTRWGIGDIYFLGMFYGKVETIEGQVKRLKHRTAVITNGRVLDDLDHVIKVLGFDSDFGVDRVMKAKVHLGFWPDGDHRRWVCSDQSAIDASRFGGTAIAPYAAACTYWPHHFFKYPLDAKRILAMGIISENKAKPELGSAAYHYEPRIAATVQVTYGSVIPEIAEFSAHNDGFKKGSMWCVAPVHRFLYECERDWMRYCEKFKEFGDDRPFPPYPYDLQFMYDLLKSEAEDGMQMAARQGAMRQSDIDAQLFGIDQQHAHAVATGQEDIDRRKAADWFRREAKYKPAEEWAAPAEMPPKPEGHELTLKQILSYYNPQKPAEDGEIRPMPIQSSSQPENSAIAPGSEQSWLPARQVLKCRASSPDYGRSPSPASRKLQEEWLSGANMLRDAILQQAKLEGAK